MIQELNKDNLAQIISDNSKVMGYPAKNIRDFLKDNK